MLGLWSVYTSPLAMKLHYAFQVGIDAVEASVAALKDAGLRPLSGTGMPIDEPEVIPWIPAASVYFRDPDGHSLEYHRHAAATTGAAHEAHAAVGMAQAAANRGGIRRVIRTALAASSHGGMRYALLPCKIRQTTPRQARCTVGSASW